MWYPGRDQEKGWDKAFIAERNLAVECIATVSSGTVKKCIILIWPYSLCIWPNWSYAVWAPLPQTGIFVVYLTTIQRNGRCIGEISVQQTIVPQIWSNFHDQWDSYDALCVSKQQIMTCKTYLPSHDHNDILQHFWRVNWFSVVVQHDRHLLKMAVNEFKLAFF